VDIRRAHEADFAAMRRLSEAVLDGGDAYVVDPGSPPEDTRAYWLGPGVTSFVALDDAHAVVGMYRLVANWPGRGSHVANASFMVSPAAQGQGVGKAMGLHCLAEARKAGFLAMQFNFVVSTNRAAVALWQQLGFAIVGTLPQAFRHKTLGLVDACVMYRTIDQPDPG
jgi:ribosomal protein S18 acetylase RimI-like enzyme